MNVRQLLLVANIVVIAACILILALIIVSKGHRGRRIANAAKQVAPHRHALLEVAAGEDEAGLAKRELSDLGPAVWKHTNPWRSQGWWASLRGTKQVWGTMTRTGFDSEGS